MKLQISEIAVVSGFQPDRRQIPGWRLPMTAALLGWLVLQGSAQTPAFTYRQVMVPVRDGVRLETVIAAPANASGPLPILVRRTPYGVPENAEFASGPDAQGTGA